MTNRWGMVALALLLTFCVSLVVLATGTWTQWYDHEHEVHVGTVLEMGDEYWLIGTAVASFDPPDAGIVVFRIEPDGDLLYPVAYDWDGVQSAGDAFVDAEGNVLFVGRTTSYGAIGSDMYVLKTDSSGQTLAEWVYGEALEEFACCVVPGPHGDSFVVGNQMDLDDVIADPGVPGYGGLEGRTAPYIVRIDSNGAPVWRKSYRSEENVIVFGAAPADDGGCYILSTVYGYPDADDCARLERLDENGAILWTSTLNEGNGTGYSLLQLDDGSLLIAGARSNADGRSQAMLMLLEATGQEIWSRTYGDPDRISTLHALVETQDGDFVAVGTQLDDYGRYRDDIYVLCVDAEGELQWEQTHPTGKHVMVEGLAEADGGFLIAVTGAAAGEPFQAMLMRIEP